MPAYSIARLRNTLGEGSWDDGQRENRQLTCVGVEGNLIGSAPNSTFVPTNRDISAALPIDNEKLRRVAARGSALSERGKFAIPQTYRRVAAYSHAEWVGSCALAERKASRWRKEPSVEAIEILEAQQV